MKQTNNHLVANIVCWQTYVPLTSLVAQELA